MVPWASNRKRKLWQTRVAEHLVSFLGALFQTKSKEREQDVFPLKRGIGAAKQVG